MPNRETESALSKLEVDFKAWLENRVGQDHYPEELKERAVSLCRFYSMSHVAKHVGVERSSVTNWVKQANEKQIVVAPDPLKQSISTNPSSFFEISQTPQIMIEHHSKDGSVLRISGALSDKAVLDYLSRIKI